MATVRESATRTATIPMFPIHAASVKGKSAPSQIILGVRVEANSVPMPLGVANGRLAVGKMSQRPTIGASHSA